MTAAAKDLASAPPAPANRPQAIVHPVVDFLCAGGLSLIVIVPLLVSGQDNLRFMGVAALAWTQAIINYSHFMASYRIIYRDKQMILRHKWAAIGVPLILLAFLLAAVAQAPRSNVLLVVFFAVASGYLAWHYTGQVWGMMASYAYLGGTSFDPTERFLIRGSLRILLAWHVTWFLYTTLRDRSSVEPVYVVVSAGTVLALVAGVLGLLRMRKRTGRLPPARALVAWIAIFFWYAALARWGLPALFLVQLFHALQYLEFPARVELNRATGRSAGRTALHMALYAIILLVVSLFVSLTVPGPAMSVVANFLGAGPQTVVPVLILYFINIHHYFTDGVIWKISNPEVRKELFAHVRRPEPVPAAAPGARHRDRRKPPNR